ncbi:DUF2948 family protein [Rhodobacteraceae bacterium 2376]|uniref:DUF2948 family protein n=1 Tax=Rhabdonatronobacter sediminivivens TaxID=2743469 RepID=A0A7Z0KYM5_9RHOB|nr:DUF2948 family protein [Rhabdonatronobacter sediminivivens]NYS23558.1 DUF2948 family protein [Rhabdonatronobacter sediminivivens]
MADARFEDTNEAPLRLRAQDAEDLKVMAALLQDAVFPVTEMTYDRRRRRFALLVNRFRWEHDARPPERVQSLLIVNDVLAAATQGVDRAESDLVLSLLSLEFTPGEDGAGTLDLVLAGDGGVRLSVECVDLALRDVTRPYVAPSGRVPSHPQDSADGES